MYPYDFKPSSEWPIHDRVFVAMPFAEEYKWIYDDIIQPAVKQCKMKSHRADEDPATQVGWRNIMEQIHSCRLMISVIDKDHNANVYYEMGIAHALRPIDTQIIMTPNLSDFQRKFDLQHITDIKYPRKRGCTRQITQAINNLENAIRDKLSLSVTLEKKRICEAVKWLTPLENKAIHDVIDKSRKSHFTLQIEKDAHMQLIISDLFKKKLLRLSLHSMRSGVLIKESHSIYWTELGLHVLHTLQLIDEKTFDKWIKEYRKLEAQGNFLVSPVLEVTDKELP